jgi:DNA polymerase-3 subunit beta
MKILVLQENLSKALNYVNRAVSNRPNIPILSNCLIEAEKDKLKLSATNLEIGISTWIGADISDQGKVTVSAKLLSEFINSLKPGKVTLGISEQLFEVNFVDNKAEFFIIPAEDFPKVPQSEGDYLLEVGALDFADAISKTAFAAGTDESRPVLTGVLLTAKEKLLTLVGVDGFRLSKKEIKLENAVKGEDVKEIIPAKSLIEVEKLIHEVADKKDMVQIYYLGTKNQILFKFNNLEFSTRLIEGEFPDYQKIIPTESVIKFTVPREDLSNVIKIASIFARNVIGNKTRFKVDSEEKLLSLSASVVDVGKNESKVELKEIRGESLETGFNIRYLNEMITAIKAKEITFQSNGATAPGVFLDSEDPDFIHIIMPMRLD